MRVQVAAIGVPLILLIIFLLPAWVFGIALGAVSAVGVVEFLRATKVALGMRILIYAAVSGFAIPLVLSFWQMGMVHGLLVAVCLLLALFIEAMLHFNTPREISFSQISLVFFAGGILPLMLGTLSVLRAIISIPIPGMYFDGRVYVLIPILIAFTTDAGGYFAGGAFGKRRLIEKISPKKTIEGSLGGFAASFVTMLIFCLVMILAFSAEHNIVSVFLLSIVGSAVTQVGDLAFSLIKREYGVKDFSALIPGHGGVLDRFDSLIFVAPVICAFVFLWPPFLQG